MYENDDIVTPIKQSPKKSSVTPVTPKAVTPSTPKSSSMPKIAMKSTQKPTPALIPLPVKEKEEVKEKEKEPVKKKELKLPSEKKIKTTSYTATSSNAFLSPDKKVAQKIGVRLRNLLKLPKAHKWVCYEWFYSNLDRYYYQRTPGIKYN